MHYILKTKPSEFYAVLVFHLLDTCVVYCLVKKFTIVLELT